MIQPLATIVLLLVLLSAVAVLAVRNLLSAVIVFGVFSFLSALLYSLLGALDVAFTEVAVGAGVTTILFVVVIHADREGKP